MIMQCFFAATWILEFVQCDVVNTVTLRPQINHDIPSYDTAPSPSFMHTYAT